MTDTDTIIDDTVVTGTIAALEATLLRATNRLATEEAEYVAKRDRMVEVAHRLGTRNSIGEALDDLLEEFDLPRRPIRRAMSVVLRISAPYDNGGSGLSMPTGNYVYPVVGQTRLTWPVALAFDAVMPSSGECGCGQAEAAVREYLPTYFGDGVAAPMDFQIGRVWCNADDGCIHDNFRTSVDLAADIDWTTIPTHKVTVDPA